MNGSGHLAEDDRQPLAFCPVDLRKLHFRLRLDVKTHHRALLEFVDASGWADAFADLRALCEARLR